MKKYTHLFFDLDRTLWDFDANALETFQELFKEYRIERYSGTFDKFYSVFQKHNNALWEEYRQGAMTKQELRRHRFHLTMLEFNMDDQEMAIRMDEDYVTNSPVKKGLFPYTIEILEYLKPKYPMYILTNGFRDVQVAKIKNCGLDRYFSRLLASEDYGKQKPDPGIFKWAVAEAGADIAGSLMIGDDPEVDIRGARNAGMDQVFFNPERKEIGLSPTYMISCLSELRSLL
jgi:putative hydrolase of the HAD superfamily